MDSALVKHFEIEDLYRIHSFDVLKNSRAALVSDQL